VVAQKVVTWLNETFNTDIENLESGIRKTTNMCPITNTLKNTGRWIQVATYPDRITVFSMEEQRTVYLPPEIKEWLLAMDSGEYIEIGEEIEWES
jgi:hypothetical protein